MKHTVLITWNHFVSHSLQPAYIKARTLWHPALGRRLPMSPQASINFFLSMALFPVLSNACIPQMTFAFLQLPCLLSSRSSYTTKMLDCFKTPSRHPVKTNHVLTRPFSSGKLHPALKPASRLSQRYDGLALMPDHSTTTASIQRAWKAAT
jgi:hypothetical protein